MPNMITPAMAAEEEEEDNFTTMPNYRWHNESVTNANVTEQLVGDQYYVNNTSDWDGTQEFAKSRQLNSRDFYFESRFALDIGGNGLSEYWTDVEGNISDFNDGSLEGWVPYSGSENYRTNENGWLNATSVSVHDVSLESIPSINVDASIYRYFAMEFYSDTGEIDYVQINGWIDTIYLNHANIPNNTKTLISCEFDADWSGTETYLDIAFYFVYDPRYSSRTVYINMTYLYDVSLPFDYATMEGDAWDWNDSDDYWVDVENNVSDFNDGTTEDWFGDPSPDVVVSNVGGWLKAQNSLSSSSFSVIIDDISVDASTYKYGAIEIYSDTDGIGSIQFVNDPGSKVIYSYTPDIPMNNKTLVNGEFDADWSGTENNLEIKVFFDTAQVGQTFYLNFTYIYDTPLGDLEDWDGYTRFNRTYVNPIPDGFFHGTCTPAGYNSTIGTANDLSIDTDQYTTLIIRLNASDPTMNIMVVANFTTYVVTVSSVIDIRSSQTNYVIFLSDDADWSGICNQLFIYFDEDDGMIDGDEEITIDFVSLLGGWSTTDGFKFSLLNADSVEGMAFQFTTNPDLTCGISIDMYDSSGIALDYDYSFDYSITVDGWLLLRVDWNLDKREAKVLFEFENGTDIVNIRRITDLYGGNIGFDELLLLEEGFPSLCMNNTIGPWARSNFIISYIDADWLIIEWREPDGTWTATPAAEHYVFEQDDESYFTSVTPYGASIYHKAIDDKDKWYRLCVDRFDGLNFEFSAYLESFNTWSDHMVWTMGVYNVRRNGTLEPLFRYHFKIWGSDPNHWMTAKIYIGSNEAAERLVAVDTHSMEGSIAVFYESGSKIVMQDRWTSVDMEYHGTHTVSPDDEVGFTKEMVIMFAYHADGWNTPQTQEVQINIGGFEVTRKDIIGGWLVGAILGPFFAMMAILFSPFIVLFQMLTVSLIKSFKELVSNLEPLFDMLGDVFTDAIALLPDAIKDAITGLFTTLQTAVVGAIVGMWVALFAFGPQAGAFIAGVIAWIMGTAEEAFTAIWGFGAGLVFWLWSTLGMPDLLAILGWVIGAGFAAVNAVPAILQGVTDLIIFWHFWILLGIWVVVLPFQAAQCDGFSDFFERIIGVFSINCFPFFGVWFPVCIPLVFWTCSEIIILV